MWLLAVHSKEVGQRILVIDVFLLLKFDCVGRLRSLGSQCAYICIGLGSENILEKPSQNNDRDQSELVAALARLNKALDLLDNSVDQSLEANTVVLSADAEVQRMADDRAKIARELDEAEARAARLMETNKEVSKRLVGAMETVRRVVDQSV